MPSPTTPTTPNHGRDYARVLAKLAPQMKGPADRTQRMQAVVDALWEELNDKGCSWVGFYLKDDGEDQMLLGPRRDKPACSPIGLFGACGRCWSSRRPLVVTDVANLRAGYIACDPRDRSEVVIPMLEGEDEGEGGCWGVLDLDSHDSDSFSISDVEGLLKVVEQMGLSAEQDEVPLAVRVETV